VIILELRKAAGPRLALVRALDMVVAWPHIIPGGIVGGPVGLSAISSRQSVLDGVHNWKDQKLNTEKKWLIPAGLTFQMNIRLKVPF